MTEVQFQRGDRVVHQLRPEWGEGVIQQVTRTTHNGAAAHRLVIEFSNQGRMTLMTPPAPVVARNGNNRMESEMSSSATTGQGWLAQLEQKAQGGGNELTALPDELTDPFATEEQRLRRTLATYRFSTEARSLIDWAVSQTGLSDPLTKYTRHDLEEAFKYYTHGRNAHLVELVRDMKRGGQLETVNRVLKETDNPSARQALNKAISA